MFGLFLQADFIVKAVIILLISASVWTWAIIFEKVMLLRSANDAAGKFLDKYDEGRYDQLYDELESKASFSHDPMSAIFMSAMKEWRKSSMALMGGIHGASLAQRLDRIMQVTMDRGMERIEKRMTFLASTGAVSPFIGLFGTVWGIMNSFHSIGASSNTSLAVVAPGIAEALFATALGLVAAIPAVLAYNKLSSDINRYAKKLENFAGDFSSILSRQIDNMAIRNEKQRNG